MFASRILATRDRFLGLLSSAVPCANEYRPSRACLSHD